MTPVTLQILIVLAVYTIGVMVLGFLSYRKEATITDFLMANREFKYFVLFSAVFGANISAVTLVGVPGLSYHIGWVTWAYFCTTWAWLTPLFYYTIGSRAYPLSKKFDIVTISELLGKRWADRKIQIISAIFLLFYLIPYMMVGIIGGGKTFVGLTHGFIPYWTGCLLVTVIVCIYVLIGGMRGAAWVNTFQTAVFLIGSLAIFLVIVNSLGGFGNATSSIVDKYPELLNRSKMPWQRFFSYGIVCALAVPVFPNVFSRLLTGKSPKELKKIVMIYPFAGIILFIFMAYSGMWGHIHFSGLKGAESDAILGMILAKYAPAWMAGVLGAAIFAALMSTLDSQLLAIGQILMKDFILPRRKDNAAKKSDTKWSRLVVLLFALLAFFLALVKPAGIIKIVEWGFGGFASMFFPVIAALYWKRCGKGAVLASILVSQFLNIALPLGLIPAAQLGGFLPAFWSIVGGGIILVIGALITPAPDKQKTDDFFASFAGK
ncbi:MAG: sodium:solute symporter family protein [Chitinispirillaceae bacterium]|nr:sodium:solute symporter family protein [Chitinispirillaceae bacterium]